MSGQQQIVAAGGAGLVVLAFWTGESHKTISDGLFHSHASDKSIRAAHAELVKLAAAVLFVAVATILAGLSSQWGTAMTAVVAGLFILWAITRYGGKSK